MTLFFLALYAAAMVAVGLYIGRRVDSASDFFVAGRRLSAGLLFSTLLAANIGAGSTVGAASLGYRDGLAAWWWVGSAGIGTFFLAYWVGPRIWKIASQGDLRTAGDFLELRYGPQVRGLVAVLLWLGTLAILAGQLIALAWVLHAVAGIPKICRLPDRRRGDDHLLRGRRPAHLGLGQPGAAGGAAARLRPGAALRAGGKAGGGRAPCRRRPSSAAAISGRAERAAGPLLFLLGPAFLISPGLLQKIYGAKRRPRGAARHRLVRGRPAAASRRSRRCSAWPP